MDTAIIKNQGMPWFGKSGRVTVWSCRAGHGRARFCSVRFGLVWWGMAKHCNIHKQTELITYCPACRGAKGGSVKSKKKAKASRKSGKLGGRPKKA